MVQADVHAVGALLADVDQLQLDVLDRVADRAAAGERDDATGPALASVVRSAKP